MSYEPTYLQHSWDAVSTGSVLPTGQTNVFGNCSVFNTVVFGNANQGQTNGNSTVSDDTSPPSQLPSAAAPEGFDLGWLATEAEGTVID